MLIGINLLNFESDKIDGVGYHMKRILLMLQERQDENKYLLMVPKGFNCTKVLDIFNDEKIKIINFPHFTNKLYRVAYKFFIFPLILKKYNIDILYSPAPPLSPFIPKEISVVTTIHDLNPLCVNRKQGIILPYYYKILVKLAIKRSDMILTVSENSKKDIISCFKIHPNKISILYNFITGMKFEQHSCGKFFIIVSTIHPAKNLERTMLAFKLFGELYKDYKLYIIGRDGWGTEVIKNYPEHLGITGKIIFTGYLNEEKLDWYFKNCAALIHASLYEGFGLPPLEAMYYGKPSVVSNVSSLPEVVGNAGILVDPNKPESIAEGMMKVIDPSIREDLIKQIPIQLKKFNGVEQVNNLINIFEEVRKLKNKILLL
jgi:glycosyltransferase involved in cell wall biosynthesis